MMFNIFNKQPNLSKIPQKKESLESLWRLTKILMENLEFEDVVYKVVNSLLNELGYLKSGYRIVVLSLVDEKAGGLRRIALSQTEEARRATSVSTIPFEKIVIPFNATSNLGIKVLIKGKPEVTTYWPDILSPPLTPQAALTNQKSAGIQTSMIYPIFSRGKPIGTLIFSMVKEYKDVKEEEKDLLSGFTNLIGLAVENSMLFRSLKETTQKLEQTNQKLKELDRLKDDFVSVASHELRTPMAAIKSYAWMALHRSDIPLSQKLQRYIYRVLLSTERLINLVNDMLNVSRIEAGKIEIVPQAFNILEFMKEIVDEIKPKADEKRIAIVMMEHKLPEVLADPDKVHEIILNLLGNSLKFTYPGGNITIDFFTDGNMLEISIKDNGAGIDKENLDKLFRKFSRLDNSYLSINTSFGGTGLGLYISKNLVERMGGRIWAQSEGMDKGATFTFSLPIATDAVLRNANRYRFRPKGEVKGLEPVAL